MGKKVKISLGGGYDPATFWMDGGNIMCKSKEFGTIKHPRTIEELKLHFCRMDSEGAKFTIY